MIDVSFSDHEASMDQMINGTSPSIGVAMTVVGNLSSSCLRCVFKNNKAIDAGAVYVSELASPIFNASNFTSNQAVGIPAASVC